jgi:hypothetical protein
MFASFVLATHGKPRSVRVGAAAAFLVHVVIATTIGVVLFRLVPHRALAGVFLAGAILALREARKAREEQEAETKLVYGEAASHRQTVVTAFVVIFLADWGAHADPDCEPRSAAPLTALGRHRRAPSPLAGRRYRGNQRNGPSAISQGRNDPEGNHGRDPRARGLLSLECHPVEERVAGTAP